MECTCRICKGACKRKPGWFVPDEIESLFNTNVFTSKDFGSKLIIDYWVGIDDNPIFVVSPFWKSCLVRPNIPIASYFKATGQCIFFNEDELCTIHDYKPFECRLFDHTVKHLDTKRIHMMVALAWKQSQNLIEELSGYKIDVLYDMYREILITDSPYDI